MKKINVNSNCNGCGICLIVSKYFLENDEGLTEVKRNIVDEADLAQVENVIAQCPTSAIILREDMVSVNDKSAAIKNIISELKKSLNVVNIPRVKEKDMSFDIDKYTFPYPTSPNEITTDYKSEMSAKSGAKEDFNRLVYGEAARNTLITKILVEQKVATCSQYYTLTADERSFYFNENKKIEKILESCLLDISGVIDKPLSIKVDWTKVKCFPRKDNLSYVFLEQFPKNTGFMESIWKYVRDLGPTTLSDYVDYMDFDYFEAFAGFGLFDRVKTKKEWNFKDFRKATDEFYTDLKRAFQYESDDIARYLAEMANNVINDYKEHLKKIIKDKLDEIKESVKAYL